MTNSSVSSVLSFLFYCALFITACNQDKHPQLGQDQFIGERIDEVESGIDWSRCAQWIHDPSGDSLTTYPDDSAENTNNSTGIQIDFSQRPWTDQASAFV